MSPAGNSALQSSKLVDVSVVPKEWKVTSSSLLAFSLSHRRMIFAFLYIALEICLILVMAAAAINQLNGCLSTIADNAPHEANDPAEKSKAETLSNVHIAGSTIAVNKVPELLWDAWLWLKDQVSNLSSLVVKNLEGTWQLIVKTAKGFFRLVVKSVTHALKAVKYVL